MKKAFTMLELVFVIVVMGILAVVVMPNTRSNPVHEAAVQLTNHIRYTQHLAMVDDKYNPSSTDSGTGAVIWYKERWGIVFYSGAETYNKEAYTIFSDNALNSTGHPQESEIALNPENSNQRLTGGYSGANALDMRQEVFVGMKKLNIGQTYGVTVSFDNTCSKSGSKRVSFDHLGRPIFAKQSSMTSPYNVSTPFAAYKQRLITVDCDITITDGQEIVIVRIAPETGFTCILDDSTPKKCIK